MFDSFQEALEHWYLKGTLHGTLSTSDWRYYYCLQAWEQAELDASYDAGYEA